MIHVFIEYIKFAALVRILYLRIFLITGADFVFGAAVYQFNDHIPLGHFRFAVLI